jgi:hypothetical protein
MELPLIRIVTFIVALPLRNRIKGRIDLTQKPLSRGALHTFPNVAHRLPMFNDLEIFTELLRVFT